MVMLASFNELRIGKSLAAQWLGLSDFTAEGPGSVLGWESKIPQAVQSGEKNLGLFPPLLFPHE